MYKHIISEHPEGDIYVHSNVYKQAEKNVPLLLVGGNSDTIIFKLEDNFLGSI